MTGSTACDNNTSHTRGWIRANASVVAQGIKHPPPPAAGRPPPRYYYGDIVQFAAVAAAAVALGDARQALQRNVGKLLEADGRRGERKERRQWMEMVEICGVSSLVVAEEGVVGEEQRAAAAAFFSALGEEAHPRLERTTGVRPRAKISVT